MNSLVGITLELAYNGGSTISLSCKLVPVQNREYENGLVLVQFTQ